MRIEGFVNNLLNEEYVGIAFDVNPDPTTAMYVGQNGAPRTFGLSMSLMF
jgi:outer membrane receptor protein involved in Fe transport